MITLKDIAAEAGVSVMTVSNVIRQNYARVSPATVERVQKIIEKYDYVPNMAARSLSGKKSRIIALLLPIWYERTDSLLFNPYVGRLVGSLDMLIREKGYYSMLCSFNHVDQVIGFQRNWQIDGSIMVLPHVDDVTRGVVEQTRTPLVVIDRRFDDIPMNAVLLDDKKGGYLATKYLLDHGHRRIGFACPGLADSSVLQDRYRGYRQALREAGLEPDDRWLFPRHHQQQGGEIIAQALMEMGERPTGIVSTEDLIACGIIQTLHRAGWSLPEDLSVVGFDDSLPARLISPALTTIHQDISRKAEDAFELLMAAIGGDGEPHTRTLDVSIAERESVASI